MLVNERVLMIYPSDKFSVEFSSGISTAAICSGLGARQVQHIPTTWRNKTETSQA